MPPNHSGLGGKQSVIRYRFAELVIERPGAEGREREEVAGGSGHVDVRNVARGERNRTSCSHEVTNLRTGVQTIQMAQGTVSKALQMAKLIVQAAQSEVVTAQAMTKTITRPMAEAVTAVADCVPAAVAKTVAVTTEQASQTTSVLADNMIALQRRIKLRRAVGAEHIRTTVAVPEAMPATVPEAMPATVPAAVALSEAMTNPMSETTMTEPVKAAGQVGGHPVQMPGGSMSGTDDPRSGILSIVAVRNRGGVVQFSRFQITSVGHSGNRVNPRGDVGYEPTRRGITGQGAEQRDRQSQTSPMSDTHGQSLVNVAGLPPGVVRNRARRAGPRRPVRGRRHPPIQAARNGDGASPWAFPAVVRTVWGRPGTPALVERLAL